MANSYARPHFGTGKRAVQNDIQRGMLEMRKVVGDEKIGALPKLQNAL